MHHFTHPDLSSIHQTLAGQRLIAVGELHGINENATVVQVLLDELLSRDQSVCLAFEWLLAPEELAALQGYLKGEALTGTIPPFFLESDGRVTAAHILLLEHARAHNQQNDHKVDIAVFDTDKPRRERLMAQQLEQISRNYRGYVLAEMGVVHARRSGEGSLVDILSTAIPVYAMFIAYQKGVAAVEGEVYSVRDSYEQQRGPEDHFDAVITIEKATSSDTTILKDELQKLYGGPV